MSIRIDELIARRGDLLIELDALSLNALCMEIVSAPQQIESNPVAFKGLDHLMGGWLAPALAETDLPPQELVQTV